MSGLLDLLNSDTAKQLISSTSRETGASEEKTSSVLGMVMPLLTGAMNKNAQSEQGASGLMNALSNKHDGSILDNLSSILGGDNVDEDVKKDGDGILGHVLGGKRNRVEQTIGQKVGMDSGSVGQILKIAAPIVMGLLGKEKQKNNVNDSSGLSGMLGGLMGGGTSGGDQSWITSMLDQNGDGSVLDDVSGMILGNSNSKGNSGGLGSILGN